MEQMKRRDDDDDDDDDDDGADEKILYQTVFIYVYTELRKFFIQNFFVSLALNTNFSIVKSCMILKVFTTKFSFSFSSFSS